MLITLLYSLFACRQSPAWVVEYAPFALALLRSAETDVDGSPRPEDSEWPSAAVAAMNAVSPSAASTRILMRTFPA